MQGLHLTGDLSGCRCAPLCLTDPATLETLCLAAARAAGLSQVNHLFHSFANDGNPIPSGSGATGVVLLAESHLAVHTWPELNAVTLDVYVCNYGGDNSAKARALFDELLRVFDPAQQDMQTLLRGRAAA